jgi:hypothetical protein
MATQQHSELETHARGLATRFNSDYEQTLTTLQRLSDDVLPVFTSMEEDETGSSTNLAVSILCAAYNEIPWEDAVTLLAETPPSILAERLWVPRYLSGIDSDSGIPLFSRLELAEQLRAFRSFLVHEQKYLVETGLPSKTFAGSRWLAARLAKCYPVRRSENDEPFEDLVDARGVNVAYHWLKIVRNWQNMEFHEERVAQAEADLLEGFEISDALELERLRAIVFILKLAVIEEAEHALRSDGTCEVWPTCLGKFVAALSADEAAFLSRMDTAYRNPPAGNRLSHALAAILRMRVPAEPGGLSNLIDLVGHVEQECTIGLMHNTREALGDLVTSSDTGQVLGSGLSWPYFEFIGRTNEQETVESAVSVFIECDANENEFWPRFYARVEAALGKQFESKVLIEFRSKASVAEKLRRHVASYAEIARNTIESSGKLPALKIQLAAKPADSADSKADSKNKIPESDRVLKAIKALNDHYKKVGRGKAAEMKVNAILSEHLDKPVDSDDVKNLARQLRNYAHLIHKPADS